MNFFFIKIPDSFPFRNHCCLHRHPGFHPLAKQSEDIVFLDDKLIEDEFFDKLIIGVWMISSGAPN